MEIKISGSSKEIADLASELQNRLISNQNKTHKAKVEQQSRPLSLSVGYCVLKDIEDMQTNAIKTEIISALQKLGYHGVKGRVKHIAYHLYEVAVNGKRVGIYDIDKHTFID